MIEPELAFATLDDLMDLAEDFLTHILIRVLEHHRQDLTTIGRDLSKLDRILAPTSTPDNALATPDNASATPDAVHPERAKEPL